MGGMRWWHVRCTHVERRTNISTWKGTGILSHGARRERAPSFDERASSDPPIYLLLWTAFARAIMLSSYRSSCLVLCGRSKLFGRRYDATAASCSCVVRAVEIMRLLLPALTSCSLSSFLPRTALALYGRSTLHASHIIFASGGGRSRAAGGAVWWAAHHFAGLQWGRGGDRGRGGG